MTKLYSIFQTDCENQTQNLPSRNVLSDEFKRLNLAFFQPKKDLCDLCCSYEAKNISEEVYQQHVNAKERARKEKRDDKYIAKTEGSGYSVWTMDLEAVLLSPKLNASALYYKTKLSCHNFTLYNLSNGNVLCYFWDETQGEITANIFSSCVYDFLKELINQDPTIHTIILYSDSCPYQNKNCMLSNAILHFATTYGKVVIQKYLLKGHTQMEVDSVHSVIERQVKQTSIYYPGDYVRIMQDVRPDNPYNL